jgi:outer membrane protein OmpA-like peptidoglycan-associated protein
VRRAAILLPLVALLSLGAAPAPQPRDLCKPPYRTPARLCTILFFYHDSDEVVPSAWPILDVVVTEVENHEGAALVLAGYTDAIRYPEGAMARSQRTAENTRDYLIQHGVDAEAITVEAHGTANPRIPNGPGGDAAENRRVEVWVTWQ